MLFSFRFGVQTANAWALAWFTSLMCGILLLNPLTIFAMATLRHVFVWHFANLMVTEVAAGGAHASRLAGAGGIGALAAAGVAGAAVVRDQFH